MPNWYSISIDKVFKELASSEKGLDGNAVEERQERYGLNELKTTGGKGWFALFAEQFKDVMIIILILAAVVSFLVGEHTDAIVIVAIIVGNAIIGFIQEYNAEKSLQALKKMAASHAIVVRDGSNKEVEVQEIVPGDIIRLEAGDIVPADARLFEVNSFKVEEAALTGESESVSKITDTINEDGLMAGDKLNMVFKGTIVSKGTARAVVTATGMETEMGKIAEMLVADDVKTPLQKRLATFSKKLAAIVIVICLIVFGLGVLRGEPILRIFLTALSLAVAALPEALPAVITIALARGASRMVKRSALVRKLPAVETLGSVTYICSDKTGTLTQNKMTVTKVEAAEGMKELLLHAMMLNHEVKVNAEDELIGDPTEKGIVARALDDGQSYEESWESYPIVDTIPFDSDRMLMTTLHKNDEQHIVMVKGAPVKVLERLKDSEDKERWISLNRKWAAEGLRVLLFAYKKVKGSVPNTHKELESELEILGAVGMIDPPREEVVAAIKECKAAGIKVVMITGDQPVTAMAIAKELNIADDDNEILTGAQVQQMSDEEFAQQIKNVKVYARVSPEQKVNIVEALQKDGQFVSMTGDGVNDAPSLKRANIGVAMGVTGTDVAKEASDMILLDDNFTTIVKAVREGRRIYDNIRKFVLYILACNLGEILVIFLAPFLGLPIPLLPIHILWINLVTDGLPGIALAAETAEKDIMKRAPVPPQENLFARGLMQHVLFTGVVLAAVSLGAQYWANSHGVDLRTQQTLVFTVLCFAQLLNALSVRSSNKPIYAMPLFSNPMMIYSILGTVALQFIIIYTPALETIFKVNELDQNMLAVTGIAAVAALVLIELFKRLYYARVQKVNA